jgi:xanthine dehydrogenase small subunit
MRNAIRFLRKGRVVELGSLPPMRTVLDYLRLEEGSRGTKEGCNEGDCGACTVALGTLRQGKVVYEPVNACILLAGQLDGKELVTVDDLSDGDGLHPVQQAMVDLHASQCGFCTPGFVMSLFTLYQAGETPDRARIAEHVAGNLCRCTGYRPIIDAAARACQGRPLDRWAAAAQETAGKLAALDDGADVFLGSPQSFLAAPATTEALLSLCANHPDATIVAGATDVSLWITKQLRELPKIILVGRVKELHHVGQDGGTLRIGAAATYAEATAALTAIDPDIANTLRRIGSTQVRASGTIGGNIANGSPIGDMPPVLIALGASLTLRSAAGTRVMPLEDYFIAYGKQNRQPGELVWQVDVPTLKQGEVFRSFKLSKRFDQDISAVMMALKLQLSGRRIVGASLACGGMAATPKRATATEAALAGQNLDDPSSWFTALAALATDYAPISDMRASAVYRREAAQGLLRRALIEIAGAPSDATRIVGLRQGAA